MSQIYTILFDLDGTIIDTAPDLMDAHNHVMKKFGHEKLEIYQILKKLAGKGALDHDAKDLLRKKLQMKS